MSKKGLGEDDRLNVLAAGPILRGSQHPLSQPLRCLPFAVPLRLLAHPRQHYKQVKELVSVWNQAMWDEQGSKGACKTPCEVEKAYRTRESATVGQAASPSTMTTAWGAFWVLNRRKAARPRLLALCRLSEGARARKPAPTTSSSTGAATVVDTGASTCSVLSFFDGGSIDVVSGAGRGSS